MFELRHLTQENARSARQMAQQILDRFAFRPRDGAGNLYRQRYSSVYVCCVFCSIKVYRCVNLSKSLRLNFHLSVWFWKTVLKELTPEPPTRWQGKRLIDSPSCQQMAQEKPWESFDLRPLSSGWKPSAEERITEGKDWQSAIMLNKVGAKVWVYANKFASHWKGAIYIVVSLQ